MDAETLHDLGIVLTFAGILITLIAVILLFISSVRTSGKEKREVKGGGAIIIGPFPIVFGTDKELIKTIFLLSLILTILVVIVTVTFYLVFK